MANYNSMKKDELIKVLKEKDAAIAGFEETNKLLSKENDDLTVKVQGLTKDCEGMTEECTNLSNRANCLSDDLRKSNEICKNLSKEKEAIRIEKNAFRTTIEQKEEIISTLKTQRIILLVAAIVLPIVSAIIF